MIDHINAYALTVRDVKKCAEFYRDKLGFKLAELQDNFAYLKIGDKGGPGIALVSAEGLAQEIPRERVRPGENLLHRNYFATFLDDADRAYEELSQKGVRFVQPPATRPDGQRYAFFEDPEGNLWEISHFPKK
jgi:lactoylglutathione lyase